MYGGGGVAGQIKLQEQLVVVFVGVVVIVFAAVEASPRLVGQAAGWGVGGGWQCQRH